MSLALRITPSALLIGRDRGLLDALAARRQSTTQRWEPVEPGLEDVFIGLMRGVEDNFR